MKAIITKELFRERIFFKANFYKLGVYDSIEIPPLSLETFPDSNDSTTINIKFFLFCGITVKY